MRQRRAERPSLVRTVTVTIVVTALAAIILQLVIVAARTYFDEEDLIVTYVSHEVKRLAHIIKASGGDLRIKPGRLPRHFRDIDASAYALRISLQDHTQLAAHNAGLFDDFSPWSSVDNRHNSNVGQDMWLVNLDPNRRLYVAGGQRVMINNHQVLIEVATLGDPWLTSTGIIITELLDDVWMPMIPLLLITIGATVLSVRRSLRPLAEMAALVESSHGNGNMTNIGLLAQRADLPKEVQSFVDAINELLLKVGDLLAAQRSFVARAAHELRTPLAAMVLEIERTEGPDVARLQSDIEVLSQIVDQLLVLARLETFEIAKPEPLDLEFIAEDVIEQVAPIARSRQQFIILSPNGQTEVEADVSSIQHAMRNLIQNAVFHTPQGTTIWVAVGPGAQFSVADNGPGWGSFAPAHLSEPFQKGNSASAGTGLGLFIVKRATELLGARLEFGNSEMGGAKIVVDWRK